MFHTLVAKIPQEGIPCSQRQKPQRRTLTQARFWKKSIHHFVGSPVPADRDELSLTLRVGLARNPRGIEGALRLGNVDRNPARSQPLQRRLQQFTAAPTACRRIHDSQIRPRLGHSPTTAPRSTVLPNSSASTCLLIFIDAVRGKSFSQITYPPTRLKSGSRRFRATISPSSELSK